MPIAVGFNAPFQEQLDFFRAKLNLPSERWDDIMKSAHDRAFIVAGAMKADLLTDLRGAIDKAIAEGRGIEAFRKDFRSIVQKHGWTGWTGEGTKVGEAWRTKVIYQTNMATSYAAGRWRQLNDPELLAVRPFWRYVHADGVLYPRPLHVSWNGLVLRHDHNFWKTHFPPNGWGCHCRVVAVRGPEEGDRTEPPDGWDQIDDRTGAPVGIDKGFDYAPGANANAPLRDLVAQKLINLDAPIGADMYEALRPALRAETEAAWGSWLDAVQADPVKRGRVQVVGAIRPDTLNWLAEQKAVVPATAEIAVQDSLIVGRKAERHAAAGDALAEEDWRQLPAMLDAPDQVLYDTRSGKLVYVAPSSDPRKAKFVVEFDFKLKKGKGETNLLVSAFKTPAEDIAGAIAGGQYEVVK